MVKKITEANDYTYRGYSIVFKKNGEVTVLDKDYRVVRSGLTDSEAREWIDAILPEEESLKESRDLYDVLNDYSEDLVGNEVDGYVFKDHESTDKFTDHLDANEIDYFIEDTSEKDKKYYGKDYLYKVVVYDDYDEDEEVGESLKEDSIADKVKASQDSKEMTKRAIRMLKNLGGDYEDLVKEFKDTYGEDPLEESLKESSGRPSYIDTYIEPKDKVTLSNFKKSLSSYPIGTYIRMCAKGPINAMNQYTYGKVKVDDNKWQAYSAVGGYSDFYSSDSDILNLIDRKGIKNIGVKVTSKSESIKESFEGMTIKDWIVDGMTRAAEDRLQKLTDMDAPQVMIDRQSEMVDELKSGKIPITGDLEVLDLPLESREIKTGRGGKTYFSINGGKINYFPYAKYGPYIKINESLKESYEVHVDMGFRKNIETYDTKEEAEARADELNQLKKKPSMRGLKIEVVPTEEESLSEDSKDLFGRPSRKYDNNFYTLKKSIPDLDNEVSSSVTVGVIKIVEKILDNLQIDDQVAAFDIVRYGEVGNLKNQLVKEIQSAIKSKVSEKTNESLNESIEDEYLEDIIGDTFIEDGVEYEWTEGYGEILETSTGKWMVLGATTTETEEPETYFFVVDVEDGFIDWGPCDTLEEASEFLEGKELDDKEEEYDEDDYPWPSFPDDYDEEEDEE